MGTEYSLSNGVEIPAIGFGTGVANGLMRHPVTLAKRIVKETAKNILIPEFKENNLYPLKKDLIKDRSLRNVVRAAYDSGCRLFDTARAYHYSENYLGEALFGRGGIKREDLFLVTKVTNRAQMEGTIEEDFELSLKNLRTDYIDLLLLHWLLPDKYLSSWRVLEKLYASGRVRAIGVCNAHVHHLEELAGMAEVGPMVNELECHPWLQQWEMRAYCREHGIQLIAHTPTAQRKKAFRDPETIARIARQHGVSTTQVILRWHYQLGDIPIPNTTSEEHVRQNLKIWDFALSDEEMLIIRGLDSNMRIWADPDSDEIYIYD